LSIWLKFTHVSALTKSTNDAMEKKITTTITFHSLSLEVKSFMSFDEIEKNEHKSFNLEVASETRNRA
jgi:hypothetical protein